MHTCYDSDFGFSIFFFGFVVFILDILLLSRFFHWLCAAATVKLHSQRQPVVFV